MTKNPLVIPVILCGGSGARLWPISDEERPKQFLPLTTKNKSLLQDTLSRSLNISKASSSSVVTVALSSMRDLVVQHLSEINPDSTSHVLCEPCSRNTAAAVAYAAEYIRKVFGEEAILWVLPSDHYIGDEMALLKAFRHGVLSAKKGKITTFGIQPTRPDTGYGYIHVGDPDPFGHNFNIRQFIEKPDLKTAESYLKDGNFLWNSGMFLLSVQTALDNFSRHAPDILSSVQLSLQNSLKKPDLSAYSKIPSESFDKAIMEKSSVTCVVPCDPEWSDVGSWESLWSLKSKDIDGNVTDGDIVTHKARNCFVQAKEKEIVLCGVEDIVVIETDNIVFVTNRNNRDSIKDFLEKTKQHDDKNNLLRNTADKKREIR